MREETGTSATGRCRTVAIVAAVALLVAACGPDRGGAVGVGLVNRTGTTVRVTYAVDGVERQLQGELDGDTIPNGRRAEYGLGLVVAADDPMHCTAGDIVIRTLDGREVDRIPPPICYGTWLALE